MEELGKDVELDVDATDFRYFEQVLLVLDGFKVIIDPRGADGTITQATGDWLDALNGELEKRFADTALCKGKAPKWGICSFGNGYRRYRMIEQWMNAWFKSGCEFVLFTGVKTSINERQGFGDLETDRLWGKGEALRNIRINRMLMVDDQVSILRAVRDWTYARTVLSPWGYRPCRG